MARSGNAGIHYFKFGNVCVVDPIVATEIQALLDIPPDVVKIHSDEERESNLVRTKLYADKYMPDDDPEGAA